MVSQMLSRKIAVYIEIDDLHSTFLSKTLPLEIFPNILPSRKPDNEQCNTIRRISNFLIVVYLSDTAKEAPMTKLKRMRRRSLERTKQKRKLRSHPRWIILVTWRGQLSGFHFPNSKGKCSSISSVIRNQTWFLCGDVKVFSIILKAVSLTIPEQILTF